MHSIIGFKTMNWQNYLPKQRLKMDDDSTDSEREEAEPNQPQVI